MTSFEGFCDSEISKASSNLEALKKKRKEILKHLAESGGLLNTCVNNLVIKKQIDVGSGDIYPEYFINGFSDEDTKLTSDKIMKLNDSMDLIKTWVEENSVGVFICKRCSRPFDTKEKFKIHQIIHQTQGSSKAFKCPLCFYATNRCYQLEHHMRIHEGDRQYKCGLCGNGFQEKLELQVHLWSHFTKCPICKKEFQETSNRNAHLWTHLQNQVPTSTML